MADEPEKPAPTPAPADDTISAEVSEPAPPLAAKAAPTAGEGDDEDDDKPAYEGAHKYGEPPPKTNWGYNYVLAFALMVNGRNLAQVARDLNFDFPKLAERARKEKWRAIARGCWEKLYRPDPKAEPKREELPELREKRLREIDLNREKITNSAERLRDQITRVADALNKLPLDQFTDTEEIANITKSIASLTKAAKDIADMTMVALGDEHAIRHLGAGGGAKTPGQSGPAIVINMPGILATSRRRQLKSVEKTVKGHKEDLRLAENHVTAIAADLNHNGQEKPDVVRPAGP